MDCERDTPTELCIADHEATAVHTMVLRDRPLADPDCVYCGGEGKFCPSTPDHCSGCEDCECINKGGAHARALL